ncbi:6-carboxytetrahydropterin synthase [uncultured Endozoicomonas sp.]|uniref:6-pyruvoyl trahydropterin synthase family protein n=1 Tax=uncultured Endozoicomonas sp. TaxID=432652 RepID=UPI0026234D39|nr:6-carboxytetrahydropterin synthase [uncultured Endozoicomonas sp.]
MQALFVNKLTTLDFSYLCPERGVVGETWIVDVTLWGDLDEQGMVFDFGHVKKQIKAMLDIMADHRLLVPCKSEMTSVSHEGNQLTVQFSAQSGLVSCVAPAQALLLVDSESITPELLTPFLEAAVLSELPENVQKVDLNLYPEDIGGAYYHYSHGLKKHDGDCQRIAHGHRSQIQVYVDEHRDQALEAWWAAQWRDIYIGTREDLLETFRVDGTEYYRFGYQANQGYFELSLPVTQCYLIDTDSTVELLAQYIVRRLAEQKPDRQIKVFAYEGLDKGAMATV